MDGMFAMPGPPLVLYCISTIDDKREYVTTLQAFTVIINLCYTFIRFHAGFYSESTWLWWLVGLSGAVIGSFIGSRFFERISHRTLKNIVYVMMIVSGGNGDFVMNISCFKKASLLLSRSKLAF